jgi:hypothetical protein
MADRYLIEHREAAVGVQMFHMRQRWGAAVWRAPFDSKWVPPVGGAPSRHTGTGGAADGVHDQYLRDSGAGDRSRVVPRSKQLGKQPDEAMSSRASS